MPLGIRDRAMAVLFSGDPIEIHGFMVPSAAAAGISCWSRMNEPESAENRSVSCHDDPLKGGGRAGDDLNRDRDVRRHLSVVDARLSGRDLRRGMVKLRTHASNLHDGRRPVNGTSRAGMARGQVAGRRAGYAIRAPHARARAAELAAGFAYLAVIMDAWSRRIVGYALDRKIDARLVTAALKAAIAF